MPVVQFLERFRALLRRRTVFDFDSELDGLSRAEQAVAFYAICVYTRIWTVLGRGVRPADSLQKQGPGVKARLGVAGGMRNSATPCVIGAGHDIRR